MLRDIMAGKKPAPSGGEKGSTGKQEDLAATGAGKKAAAKEGEQVAGAEQGSGAVVGPEETKVPKQGTPEFESLTPEYQMEALRHHAMESDPKAFEGGPMTPRAERPPQQSSPHKTGELFTGTHEEHFSRIAGPAAYAQGEAEARALGFDDPVALAMAGDKNFREARAAYEQASAQGIPVGSIPGFEHLPSAPAPGEIGANPRTSSSCAACCYDAADSRLCDYLWTSPRAAPR
jgi:hypothetical protein